MDKWIQDLNVLEIRLLLEMERSHFQADIPRVCQCCIVTLANTDISYMWISNFTCISINWFGKEYTEITYIFNYYKNYYIKIYMFIYRNNFHSSCVRQFRLHRFVFSRKVTYIQLGGKRTIVETVHVLFAALCRSYYRLKQNMRLSSSLAR